jgi:hypothetical protein
LRRFGVVGVLVALLALAPPAGAATLSREGNTIVFTDTAANVNNDVFVYKITGSDDIFIGDANATLTDAGSGCQDLSDQFECSNVAALRIVTGGANDAVGNNNGIGDAPADVPMTVDVGEGGDFVVAGPRDDDLRGGPGADTLNGRGGADLLDGGFGSDWLQGDADGDTVTYAARTETVTVDLSAAGMFPHGSANDGAAGARDHIEPDVEVIQGGAAGDILKAAAAPIAMRGAGGNDILTGSPGAETLDGGAGADTIDPLGGPDTVLGGTGVDTIETRDGAVDSVACGGEGDRAMADSIDTLSGCGPLTPPRTVVVTEPAPPVRVLFDLGYTFAAGRRGTTFRSLSADVEPGAQLTVRCRTRRGRRCRRTRDLTRAAAARAVRLRGFEGRRLPVGAKLTFRVTKTGSIGAVKTLTVKRRRAPSVTTRCLPPGATRPSAC